MGFKFEYIKLVKLAKKHNVKIVTPSGKNRKYLQIKKDLQKLNVLIK
jgi:hypothetical protein